ncbi:glycoside hydrolase [Neocallimastix lanati (nom. inval.)]|jgi:cellulose 1,4-beta-cellobiosidase|uniref:Glucanase n=1 Tax=Neocallimastix californiae TaxID=1754190 RepID=A0A1Y2F2C7_9FUNG|nr:glycoside hydrolase [Neocallimastix sp. JGI-2020a]KAG4101931.1 glycoside hydrolase [Neocallimastix sp. JGI-2020a]ORY77857.1 glycoside hydrolase [Neocallimastix californiae]|eukprot:ORY77857.1 glycoside hydrolase [Neocallimastix californiae]
MKFIVDTGRNKIDVFETFGATKTWCNFMGTTFGENPKANPDPISMTLLDAFMWIKTLGEADGTSTCERVDPICFLEDSLSKSFRC